MPRDLPILNERPPALVYTDDADERPGAIVLPVYRDHMDREPRCEPNRDARPPVSTGYWLCMLVVVLWLPIVMAISGILN